MEIQITGITIKADGVEEIRETGLFIQALMSMSRSPRSIADIQVVSETIPEASKPLISAPTTPTPLLIEPAKNVQPTPESIPSHTPPALDSSRLLTAVQPAVPQRPRLITSSAIAKLLVFLSLAAIGFIGGKLFLATTTATVTPAKTVKVKPAAKPTATPATTNDVLPPPPP